MGATATIHQTSSGKGDATKRLFPDGVGQSFLTLDALWGAVRLGDTAAFETLLARLEPIVYAVCLRVLRDPSMAQDAAQEALVHVWQQAPQLDPRFDGAKAWACMTAYRRAVDSVRSNESRRRRENAVCADRASVFSVATIPEDLDEHWGAGRVHDAVLGLGARQRQAIVLAYYEGQTYRQVAKTLGVPEGTAKTRIRSGLLQLRQVLTALGDQDALA